MSLRIVCQTQSALRLPPHDLNKRSYNTLAQGSLSLNALVTRAHLREHFIEMFDQLSSFQFFPNPQYITRDYSNIISSWKTLYALAIQSDPILKEQVLQKRVQQEYQILILSKLGQETLFAHQALHFGIINGDVEKGDIDQVFEQEMIAIATQSLNYLFQKTPAYDFHRNSCLIEAVETGNVAFIQSIINTGPVYHSARIQALFKALDLGHISIATYLFDKGCNLEEGVLVQIILHTARFCSLDMLKALFNESSIPRQVIEHTIKALEPYPKHTIHSSIDLPSFFYEPGSLHSLIINLGQDMGYKMNPIGVCLGIASAGNQAILLNDIDSFNQRLEKITLTYNDLFKSSNDKTQALHLCAQALEKDLDVKAFFDTLCFLQLTLNRMPCFFIENTTQSGNRDEELYSVIQSPKITSLGGMKQAFVTTGVYNFREFQEHLYLLQRFLDDHKTDYANPHTPWVAINIHVPTHTVAFGYNLYTQQFVINDPNALPIKSVATIEDVAQLVYRSLINELLAETFNTNITLLIATKVLSVKIPDTQLFTNLFGFSIVDARSFLKSRLIDSHSEFSLLHFACQQGDLVTIENLITSGVNLNQLADEETPLMLACCYNHTTIVQRLIELEVDVNCTNKYGETALLFACKQGDVANVRNLLKSKANPNIVANTQHSPLSYAILQKNESLLSMLMEAGADINSNHLAGWTSLHYAACCGDLGIALKLLNAQATVDPQDKRGWTPLMHATQNNHFEVGQLLIKAGANPNAIDLDWNSSLNLAIEQKNISFVTLLLNSGANATLSNPLGCIPLHFAAAYGDIEIMEKLLEVSPEVDPKDKTYWTPLMFACQSNHVPLAQLLLSAGADPRASNLDRNSPLTLAIKQKNVSLVTLLLEAIGDVNLRLPNGWTPLMYAVQENHPEVIQLLLKAGANPNLTDSVDGWTPLMLAAQYGHIELIKILIQYGANPSLRNNQGFNACSIADIHYHTEAQSLLKIGSP